MSSRALVLVAWLALMAVPAIARADVAPSPGRPEWEHTPMPMPSEPPPEAWIVLGLLAGIAGWALARREAR